MYVAAELAIRFLEKVIKTIDLPSPMLAALRISRATGTQMPVENRNLIAFWGYHSNDRGFPGAVPPVALTARILRHPVRQEQISLIFNLP